MLKTTLDMWGNKLGQMGGETKLMDEKLQGINSPACLDCRNVHCQEDNHTEQRDSYVMDLLTAIIESSHKAIQVNLAKIIQIKIVR